ncbi:hypothetical protein FVE85_9062 [Porphyridium purpureum]|uniref:Uncharacterized protein n=1 Tax=Porphyridium purpureum TaxID=35688 RepID=A0A5J4YPA2_PORPP|nr:hypothetical protein FVE85_9062 [Porphyridium purpureum]|eukprot:POR8991..scf222_8
MRMRCLPRRRQHLSAVCLCARVVLLLAACVALLAIAPSSFVRAQQVAAEAQRSADPQVGAENDALATPRASRAPAVSSLDVVAPAENEEQGMAPDPNASFVTAATNALHRRSWTKIVSSLPTPLPHRAPKKSDDAKPLPEGSVSATPAAFLDEPENDSEANTSAGASSAPQKQAGAGEAGNVLPSYDKFGAMIVTNDARMPPFSMYGFQEVPVQPYKCGGFLWVFMGHCGSSSMMETLDRVFNISIVGFEPLERFREEVCAEKNACGDLKQEVLKYFIEGREQGKVIGFKLRPWTVHRFPRFFWKLVQDFNICVVHNVRLNVVEQESTRYRREQIGISQFSVLRGAKPDLHTKVALPNKDLSKIIRMQRDKLHRGKPIVRSPSAERWFRHSIMWKEDPVRLANLSSENVKMMSWSRRVDRGVFAAAAMLGQNKLIHVSYENYLYDPATTIDYIGAELGFERRAEVKAAVLFKKSSPQGLCNILSNYAEVLKVMSHYGDLVWLMKDPLNGCEPLQETSATVAKSTI